MTVNKRQRLYVDDYSDDASSQLERELDEAANQTTAQGKPILIHLNADTSWLLSLAYPADTDPPYGRSRFNVLIDPWFKGPQSDVAPWFSSQTHAIKSSVQTISELNRLLEDLEASFEPALSASKDMARIASDDVSKTACFVDLVVISHEFTDHCHQATLEEIDRSVPVIATDQAVELIRSWQHFDEVFPMKVFAPGTDWRSTSHRPLPKWLGVSRLMTQSDALYYHSAVVICIEGKDSDESADAVIYTPHGVEATTFSTIESGSPTVRTLALLHGLNDVQLFPFKQLNLGAKNGYKAQKLLQAKYWIGTHDERKTPAGLIGPLIRITPISLLDAAAGEVSDHAAFGGSGNTLEKAVPSFVDVRNGESLVLA